jgi:hypothetical protein
MTLQEQTELAHAHQCAKGAHEAAAAVLSLLPDSVRWAELQPARQHVAALRDAAHAAWGLYLNACMQDVAEFQQAYEAQLRITRHLQAA